MDRHTEGTSNFSKNFGMLVNRIERSFRSYMDEKMRPFGLNGRMPNYLSYIDRHPGSSQDAIAVHCVLDKCTVARSAKQLENLGYITREINAQDRRQYDLHLTAKGRELLRIIKGFQDEWGERFAGVLSAEEQGTVISLMERVVDHVAIQR